MLSRLMSRQFYMVSHLFHFDRMLPMVSMLGNMAAFSELKSAARDELSQEEWGKITAYFDFVCTWANPSLRYYKRLEESGMSRAELREKKISMSREIIALIESKSSSVQARKEVKLKRIFAYETLIREVPAKEEAQWLAKLEQLDPKNRKVLRWHGGSDMFPEFKSELRQCDDVDEVSDLKDSSLHCPNESNGSSDSDSVSSKKVASDHVNSLEEVCHSSRHNHHYGLFTASGHASNHSSEAKRISMHVSDGAVPGLK